MKKYMFLLLAGILIVGGIGSAMAYDIELASGTWSGNGHEYRVLQYLYNNWDAAYIDVSLIPGGYHLATITSQGENDFVLGLINSITPVPGGQVFYLGGYQNPLNTPGANDNWTWVTGEPWVFTKWHVDVSWSEPNDHFGSASEQYLGMYKDEGWDWNDVRNIQGDGGTIGYIAESTNPVPEPATMLLLGSGLIGLAGYGRKKFFKK
jgi:hypothetical protein